MPNHETNPNTEGNPLEIKYSLQNNWTIQELQNYINWSAGNMDKESPIKAEWLVEASNEYGIPIEMLMIQAHNESHFGVDGRGVKTMNIFNVGNTDGGDGFDANDPTKADFNNFQPTWQSGINIYADLINRRYKPESGNWSDLWAGDNTFVNDNGQRYATDPSYEKNFRSGLVRLSGFNRDGEVNQDLAAKVRQENPVKEIAASDDLNLELNVGYKVANQLGYVQNPNEFKETYIDNKKAVRRLYMDLIGGAYVSDDTLNFDDFYNNYFTSEALSAQTSMSNVVSQANNDFSAAAQAYGVPTDDPNYLVEYDDNGDLVLNEVGKSIYEDMYSGDGAGMGLIPSTVKISPSRVGVQDVLFGVEDPSARRDVTRLGEPSQLKYWEINYNHNGLPTASESKFITPDGEVYWAKFPRNQDDVLQLPDVEVTPKENIEALGLPQIIEGTEEPEDVVVPRQQIDAAVTKAKRTYGGVLPIEYRYGVDIKPTEMGDKAVTVARDGLAASLALEDQFREDYIALRTKIEKGEMESDDPEYVRVRDEYQSQMNKTDYYRSIIKNPTHAQMGLDEWIQNNGNEVRDDSILKAAWDQTLTNTLFGSDLGGNRWIDQERQLVQDQSTSEAWLSTGLSFVFDAPWFFVGAGEGRLALQGGKSALKYLGGTELAAKYFVPMAKTFEAGYSKAANSAVFNNIYAKKMANSAVGKALANGGLRQGLFDRAVISGSSFGFYDATRNVAEQAKKNGSWDDIKWSSALSSYGDGLALGGFVSLTGGLTRYGLANKSGFIRKPIEFGAEIASFGFASPAIHEGRLANASDFADALFYITAAKAGGALKLENIKKLRDAPAVIRELAEVSSDPNLFKWNSTEEYMLKRHLSQFRDIVKLEKDKDGNDVETTERIYDVDNITTQDVQNWIRKVQRGDKKELDRILSSEEIPETLKWKLLAQTQGIRPNDPNKVMQPNGAKYAQDQNGWYVDLTRKELVVDAKGNIQSKETLVDRRYVNTGRQAQAEAKRLNDFGRDEAIARDLFDMTPEAHNELATIAKERKFDLNKAYDILQNKMPAERTNYEKGLVTKLERLIAEKTQNSEMKALEESERKTAELPEWNPRDFVFAEDIEGARVDPTIGSFVVPLDKAGKVMFLANRIANFGKNIVSPRSGIPIEVHRAMLRQRGDIQNIVGDAQRFLVRNYEQSLEKIEDRGLTRQEELKRLTQWVSGDLSVFSRETGRKLSPEAVRELIRKGKAYGSSDPRLALLNPEIAKDYRIENDINPGLKDFAQEAIGMVAELQTRLQKTGILGIDGDIMLDETMGIYLNRSFRMFNDPEYFKEVKKIVQGIQRNAENKLGKAPSPKLQQHYDAVEGIYRELYDGFIQKFKGNQAQARKAVAQELSTYVNEVDKLTKDDFNQVSAVIKASRGGQYKTPQGILRERKNMSESFMRFLGVYEELPTNLSQTLSKLGSLVTSAEYYTQIREMGEGKFLFYDRFTDAEGKEYKLSDNPSDFIDRYAEVLYAKTGRPIEEIKNDLNEAFDPSNPFYNTIGDKPNAPMYAKASYAPLYGARIKENYLKEFDRTLGEGLDIPRWMLSASNLSYGFLADMNASIKIGKTVYSPITQVRNYLSNQFIAFGNGHGLPLMRGEASTHRLLIDLMNVDAVGKKRSILFGLVPLGQENRSLTAERFGFESFEDLYKSANLRGLIDSDILSAEIRNATLQDPLFRESSDTDYGKPITAKDPIQANKLYRAGDSAYKLSGYLQEVKFFMNPKNGLRDGKYFLHPITGEQMTREQMLDYCGDEIRARYMTSSELPEIVRQIGRNPFFGTFISFPAEMIRTTIQGTQRDINQMNSKNSAVRNRGIRRMAYRSAAMGASYAAQQAIRNAWNNNDDNEIKITDELDAAYRTISPPWTRNAAWAVQSIDPENMTMTYLNLSNNDPYATFGTLANGIDNSLSEDENVKGAVWDWMNKTFFAQEFGVTAIDAFLFGNSRTSVLSPEYETRKIGSAAYDETTNMMVRSGAALDVVSPGVWSASAKPLLESVTGEKWSAERMAKDLANVQDMGLSEESQRKLSTELMAQFTGSRIIEVTPKEALSYQFYSSANAINNLFDSFGVEASREGRGRITVENLQNVMAQSEAEASRLMNDFKKIYEAGALILGKGQRSGESLAEVRQIAEQAGIPNEVITWIYTNDFGKFQQDIYEAKLRN